jgi:hypothetical protein
VAFGGGWQSDDFIVAAFLSLGRNRLANARENMASAGGGMMQKIASGCLILA